ncbi:MAG: GspE/PulE family protein, partial [Longimicrobiales bacterium]
MSSTRPPLEPEAPSDRSGMPLRGPERRSHDSTPNVRASVAPTPRRRYRSPTLARPQPRILGRLLVERRAVSEEDLRAALAEQAESGSRIGEILVRRGVTDEEAVARSLADQLNLRYEAPPLRPAPDAVAAVRSELIDTRAVMPLEISGRTLRLAMADPLDVATVDDIRFQTGRRIEPVVTTREAVRRALVGVDGGHLEQLLRELPSSLPEVREDDRETLEAVARSTPVVRLVEYLLQRAATEGVSDIHVEGGSDTLRVRFRIDGLLRPVTELPERSHAPILSRLKVVAGLDIAVKRKPQDGSFRFEHEDRELAVRLSTLPTSDGEKAVLRILDSSRVPESVEGLGLSPEDLGLFRSLLKAGQGVILAAGPTGSGKSSTLFGALAEVDRQILNVVTLEDPVEYRLDGVAQVQVEPRSGLSFPAALRSVLRQDPDVVMVGEIRDRETAEIAMAAAVTGHLVLSTIHTTDAPGAVTRLVNMGVPRYLVAGGLAGVVSQRLVRRLCPACHGRDPDCEACPDGYRGRTGVFQVLAMTDPLKEAVIRGAPAGDLRRLARAAGMKTLLEDARRKVAEGITSVHEVARAVNAGAATTLPCS